MVRHFVWWTLKDFAGGRTADENAQYILKESAVLRNLSCIQSMEVSINIEPSSTMPAQVVLLSTHKDMKALENYRVDPVHLEFGKKVIPLVDVRRRIDYTVPED